MTDKNPRSESHFKTIKAALQELKDYEDALNAKKEQVREILRAELLHIVSLCDTEAARVQAAHELYWFTSTPAQLLSEVFNAKSSALTQLARPLTIPLCCTECGKESNFTFTNRTDLELARNPLTKAGQPRKRDPLICQTCRDAYQHSYDESNKHYRVEQIQRAQQEAQQEARRKKELSAMPWELFVETNEWIEFRNRLIDSFRYGCQFCGAQDVRLHLYLHKNIPSHALEDLYDQNSIFFLYCDADVERCADLVNAAKGEVVKREWMSAIRQWNIDSDYRY